jgi:hypothetical protein
MAMYDRILVAFDVSPDSPDDFLERTTRFAKMTGGTVYLLHVGRGHVVVYDINAGSGLGVLDGEEDVAAGEQKECKPPSTNLPQPESLCTENSSRPPNMTSRTSFSSERTN